MVEALFILFTFALELRPMRLELNDFKDGCLKQEYSCAASEFPVLAEMVRQGEVDFDAPIQFQLRLQKSGQLVEVDGQLTTSVALSCGRCLQPYRKELAGDFAFTFTPFVVDEQVEDDIEVELETDELGLVFYKDECLDLLPPLQDQLVMALPINLVCSEECAGLCSECGCNQNIKKCNCEKKVFNSKFSALAGLKIESSDD